MTSTDVKYLNRQLALERASVLFQRELISQDQLLINAQKGLLESKDFLIQCLKEEIELKELYIKQLEERNASLSSRMYIIH